VGEGAAVGVSADGRYVAYTAKRELYLRDRLLGFATRVGEGGVLEAALSADGRYLAYTAVVDGTVEVFVHSPEGSTRLASTGVHIAEAAAYGVAISADGHYVAFVSDAADLVAGDTNGSADVFVHDRVAHSTARVSVATGGVQSAGGGLHRPGISADGRYVSFTSTGDDLIAGDTDGSADVFVHDRILNVTLRVTPPSDVDVRAESMSADGRYVTFRSVPPGKPEEVFVFDRETATTRRLHVGAGSSISADGRYVAFHATADGSPDVYLMPL
jgi:Tol biopolymer transport system component